MLISLDELQLRPVSFDLTIPPGSLNVSEAETAAVDSLHLVGEARRAGEGMRIVGHMHGEVQPLCARCVEPVPLVVDRDFDLLYQPESVLSDAGEVEIHTPDTDLGFFRGEGIELEEVAREQLLLALPMQIYCRPECRGLCPRCGANLNQGACDCPPQVDERWRALEDLRNRN